MKRRVILHGALRREDQGPIEVEANTVAEVIELVTRQLPQFRPSANGRVRIAVVGHSTEQSLYQILGDVEEIHVVPQLFGGKSALTQILVGAALIGISFIPGVGPMASSMLLKVGALTALGGISAMLAPTPLNDSSNSQEAAKYLGNPGNTVKIGTRIPVLYGRRKWGGHILAFDINAVHYAAS